MRLTPVPFPGFSSHGRLLEAGGNVTAAGSCGSSEEYNLVWIAIAIHVAGSVGINVGQNLQAMGLVALDEADRQKCSSLIRSKLWLIGCALFISCSIVNFLALGLGPASILVPLEAVQFVVNVAFGKFVRKVEVPMRMIGGVVCMVAGVALAVIFGESGSFCFTEDRLIELWTFTHGWGWWIYIAVTFGISIVCLVGHRRLWARRQAGLPVKNAAVVMPVLYAIPSALLGGAQMIVQSKCLAELTELMARGSSMTITNWFFWVEAVLVCSFGLFWFFRLTQSLGMYEPLFIIPLMQANFIVWGGIAGGIFFHEFTHVHEGPAKAASWFFYILGLGLVVLGLYLVRPKIYDEEVGAGAEEEGVAPRALPQVDASGSYNGARGGDHHKHKLPPASPMPLSSVLPNGSSLSSAPAPALATFSTN